MKTIPLTQGKFALVDDADFEWLSQWKWCAARDHKYDRWYACRHIKHKVIGMHRFVMNAPRGFHVDHKNHNGLDNRRCNLRICTNRENQQNQLRGLEFGCGTYLKNNKYWIAQITFKQKKMHISSFKSKSEAALAYQEKRKMLNSLL
ncbi:MAG: HNH endonuclease [Lutibacter sp.]|jgi:hypothetical protein